MEHPWIRSYPKGMRWELAIDLEPVQAILERSAQRFPDRPALHFMGKTTTYAELDTFAGRAAAGFASMSASSCRIRPIMSSHFSAC